MLLLACAAPAARAQTANPVSGPVAWGATTYGGPGLIDMPGAFSSPDAELGFTFGQFGGQRRTALTFQISPRLSGTFRYSRIEGIAPGGGTVYDRSFSLHYRLLDETRWRPAVAVGINDLVGTGIYGGEYVVATKTVAPRLRATLGIGWGRLGSFGGFDNPLGVIDDRFRTRPSRSSGVGGAVGGELTAEAWFRGDAALFGGLEWQATDRLRLVAEYSSDAYAREVAGGAIEHRSPVNLALAYRVGRAGTLTAQYMHGSTFGLQYSVTLNPRRPRAGSGLDPAPPPVLSRPAGVTFADPPPLAETGPLARALRAEGVRLLGATVEGRILRVDIANDRYGLATQALGRTARVLTRLADPGVDRFEIVLTEAGMPVTRVRLRREAVETLEFHVNGPDLLRAATRVGDVTDRLAPLPDSYPRLDWALQPYIAFALFDPAAPLRGDIGAALRARYEIAPGLVLSAQVRRKIAGNLDESTRVSDSVLPRVRSEGNLYDKAATAIPELTAAWYFRPGPDLFGRVTVGYLEPMFGGVSAELLWKPQNSRLALGVEVSRVRQRDFDQMFGFRDYEVTTGHVSAYYDLGRGYQARLDVGRYLAGDDGATLTLSREFANGWKIGVFATKTDVSAAEFGEGSFDKGIQITVPLDWAGGRPTRQRFETVIRPVQRDGGARLVVAGRLYDTVRGAQASGIDATWGRFWK